MSTDRELLEVIAAQVGNLTTDVTGMKQDISGMKLDISGMKLDIVGLKDRITHLDKITLKIEQEHGNKLNALLDGYKQLAESQTEMKSDINDIKARLEAQGTEIRVIQGGKSKKVK